MTFNLALLGPDGVFSSAHAAGYGIDRHALARLCDRGVLLRLSCGWFAVTGREAPSPTRRHRLTALALGRQFCSSTVVSHGSLLVCRDLPTYRADLSTVHLTSAVDDSQAVLAVARHEWPGESRTAFVLDRLGYDLEPQFGVVAQGGRHRADAR